LQIEVGRLQAPVVFFNAGQQKNVKSHSSSARLLAPVVFFNAGQQKMSKAIRPAPVYLLL
jgi:hypothetical protein